MLGIFEKASLILKGNIHELLDRASDPAQMGEQLVREMDTAISKTKEDMAEVLAEYNMLQQNITKTTSEVNKWKANAELAISNNNDELARKALEQKNTEQTKLTAYQEQFDKLKPVVEGIKSQVAKLEQKRDEMRLKADTMSSRVAVAKATQSANKILSGASGNSFGSAMDELDKRVMKEEAKAQAFVPASESLEDEFKNMQKSSVDDELAQMKAKMGK